MNAPVWTPSDAAAGPRWAPERHAARLLADLDVDAAVPERSWPEPAAAWAESGAMALTGRAEGPPRLAPDGVAIAAQGAWQAWRALCPDGPDCDPVALLSERAAHSGGRRRGATSVGGSCRLLRARGGWIALNLARPDDWTLLPAWLERTGAVADWDTAARAVASRSVHALVERGALLGLPVASAAAPPPARAWMRVAARGPRARRDPPALPRVADLTSLWAGPLCAQLLCEAGADVVKIESRERPDGARRGPGGFFDRLNAGKASVALAFGEPAGRRWLARLIDWADVVVESARPRALAQLGVDAAAWVGARPGRTWVSINGYGRQEPAAQRVAFGDDAAVSAGLATAVGDAGGPLFCGDAIADPLAGLHAAVAALGAHRRGGGALLDISLCGVAAFAVERAGATAPAARVVPRQSERDGRPKETGRDPDWELEIDGRRAAIAAPRDRVARGRARAFGADTAERLAALERGC